jgi:hypothetical protein
MWCGGQVCGVVVCGEKNFKKLKKGFLILRAPAYP